MKKAGAPYSMPGIQKCSALLVVTLLAGLSHTLWIMF